MLCVIGFGLLGAALIARMHRRHGCGGGGGRHRRWGHRGHHHLGMHYLLLRLDATPAQERALVAELRSLEARLRAARGEVAALAPALADAVRAETLDATTVAGLESSVDAAIAASRAAVVDSLRRVHALLDAEQRARLADLIEGGRRRGGGPYRG